jgi:hypothetical protein
LPSQSPSLLAGACALALIAGTSSARADKAACIDASSKGQTFADAHKVIEARDQFRICAQRECPAVIQKDCASWFEQAQGRVATLVPIAKDVSGVGLPGVKVSIDGKVVLEKIDGRPVEVDPGTHTLVFESPDGRKGDRSLVIGESEKDIVIAVVLGPPGAPPAPGPAGTAPATAAATSPAPWKTIGLVTAGVGVVSLGVGAVFGVQAIGKKNDAGCASNGMCPSSPAVTAQGDALSAADVSTGFFVAGSVLAAAGLTVFLVAPGSRVQAAPSVGRDTAGILLQGAW